jgi:hypothetical protein
VSAIDLAFGERSLTLLKTAKKPSKMISLWKDLLTTTRTRRMNGLAMILRGMMRQKWRMKWMAEMRAVLISSF